jgi:hypothetical protein
MYNLKGMETKNTILLSGKDMAGRRKRIINYSKKQTTVQMNKYNNPSFTTMF